MSHMKWFRVVMKLRMIADVHKFVFYLFGSEYRPGILNLGKKAIHTYARYQYL